MVTWLLGVAAAVYGGMPLFVKFSMVTQGTPRIEPLDVEEWPREIAEQMRRYEHDVFNMGFAITARFALPNLVPDVRNVITLFQSTRTGDHAALTAIWSKVNEEWKLGPLYLEFSTLFEDGRLFDTLNAPTLSIFRFGPETVKTRVPQVREAADLYRVHGHVLRQHDAHGPKWTYAPPEAEEFLRRAVRKEMDDQVRFGLYVRHANDDTYRPTWKGAYLSSWKLMPPMSWIRQAQMMSRARQIWDETQRDTGLARPSPFSASTN